MHDWPKAELIEMTAEIWRSATEFPANSNLPIQTSNVTVQPVAGSSHTENVSQFTTADLLWIYLGPCIFVTGVCGNILILLVLCRGRMRGTSTCVYLQTMALADLVAIITGILPDWLTAANLVTLREVHPILCKMEKFISYLSADTSIWACVVFTIDRFMAVVFPMDTVQRCPPHHAKYYVGTVFVAAIGKNLHVLITRGQELQINGSETTVLNCGSPTDAYRDFEKYVRPWIAFTFVNLLPFCIIVFCNMFIIREMIRLRRSHRQSAIISSKDSSMVIQMTALCLSASICFLVCVTPSMILLIGKPYWSKNANYDVAKAACNLIFYINHSINFFLYCVTGRKFRVELMLLFSKRTAVPKTSMARNSAELIFSYNLHKTRLGSAKTGQACLYASAPCIPDNICKATQKHTFLQDSDGAKSNQIKAASDSRLGKFTGIDGKCNPFWKGSLTPI